MLPATKKLPGGSAAVIGGLAVLILGAIAFALPQPPIAAGTSGGYLIGHSQLSDQFAEQLASSGYRYVIVDFSSAKLDKDAMWRGYLADIGQRRYPVWGWVNSDDMNHAGEVLSAVSVTGLFVYGKDAVSAAAALRMMREGFEIIPVIHKGDTPPAQGPYALVLDVDGFVDELDERAIPVLQAFQLDEAEVMAARKKRVGQNYVVAEPPLLR